jgi:hypothetical protein
MIGPMRGHRWTMRRKRAGPRNKRTGGQSSVFSPCLPICGLPLPMASSDALRSLSLSAQRNTRSNHERA